MEGEKHEEIMPLMAERTALKERGGNDVKVNCSNKEQGSTVDVWSCNSAYTPVPC